MKFVIFTSLIFSLIFSIGITDCFAAKKAHNTDKIFYGEQKRPIYYSRTNIILLRKSMPPTTSVMPWQKHAVVEDPNLIFDVEIRDGMSLYNKSGWFNLSSYSEKSGVMMVFSEPSTKPIIHSEQYAPADILFVDKQGKIIQILPNILLSELEQDIYPSSPILAFLFIKGGSCAEMSINVGDEIQYSLFKKPPTILNAPTTKIISPQQNQPQENQTNTQPILNKNGININDYP